MRVLNVGYMSKFSISSVFFRPDCRARKYHCIAMQCNAVAVAVAVAVAWHCIALHYVALHCITLHCIALHCLFCLFPCLFCLFPRLFSFFLCFLSFFAFFLVFFVFCLFSCLFCLLIKALAKGLSGGFKIVVPCVRCPLLCIALHCIATATAIS